MTLVTSQSVINQLRSRPHQTKLWLSIYRPQIAMQCQVNNDTIDVGALQIAYDGVTAGSYLNVEANYLMLIGTTPGGHDKGKIRVRSINATDITVAENRHIQWADNDYLTILYYIELTTIFPRIIQDPADEENVIFYKDYNVAYANQNSTLGTFVNMGGDYAGFRENGIAQVHWSASGSSNLRGDTLSYHWHFVGGSPTGSSQHTPGLISYSTPGHYFTKLTVSGSSTGAVDVSYRYISIYDRPGQGSNVPTLKWEISDLSGSRDSGGYSARIKILENINVSDIWDNSLVVIFADDWYGNDQTSIGGNALGRQSIVFSGYILGSTIQYNWATSSVEFMVNSPTGLLENIEGFAVSCESSNAPDTWFKILDMDIRRAVYHYLRWHSTVLQRHDLEFRGDNPKIQYFDADRTSLYESVKSLMKDALVGNFVSDRQGKLWAEIEHQAINNVTTVLDVGWQLNKQDWMGEPIIDERIIEDVSYLEIGGIAYGGSSTGTSHAFMAAAPGSTPSYSGRVERFQGLALQSQTQLNELVGNLYANRNAEYPQITFNLAGNYRNFDIAPQEITNVNIASEDTFRGIVFTNTPFVPSTVRFSYRGDIQNLVSTIVVKPITQGYPGDAIPIPEIPPSEGWYLPPFEFPKFPGGCPPGIYLYDEGVLQGQVDSLDFYGPGVTATIEGQPTGNTGKITYDCTVVSYGEIYLQTRTNPSGCYDSNENGLGIVDLRYESASGIAWVQCVNAYRTQYTGSFTTTVAGVYHIVYTGATNDPGGTIEIGGISAGANDAGSIILDAYLTLTALERVYVISNFQAGYSFGSYNLSIHRIA